MSNPQLFCFTYAGGNASFFDGIEKDLPKLDVVKFEYSGHGTRHREPLYQNFDELTDDMFCKFKERYKGGDYALFGYSMGTISLVEVLKRIFDDVLLPAPTRVFLAAHEPHTKSELEGFSSGEVDDWIKKRTIKFGTVPEKLLNNRSFWRMYLPLYRADYSIIGKYNFEKLDLKTDVPATFFYSESDTPRPDMELWRQYFVGDCDYHQYSGTHFFIQDHHEEMAAIIRQRMSGR